MGQLVRAIALGFYGQLREPGTDNDTFTIGDDEELGSWMVPADSEKSPAAGKGTKQGTSLPVTPSKPTVGTGAAGRYQAKHISNGNWKVIDSEGEGQAPIGQVFKKQDHNDDKELSKAAAEAEALRLNNGGALPEPTAPDADDTTDSSLPDA